jgi:hypothetical protein
MEAKLDIQELPIVEYFETFKPEDRLKMFAAIFDKYCCHCGNDVRQDCRVICQCNNEE